MKTTEWHFTPFKVVVLVVGGVFVGAAATAWVMSPTAPWGFLLSIASVVTSGGVVLASCRKKTSPA